MDRIVDGQHRLRFYLNVYPCLALLTPLAWLGSVAAGRGIVTSFKTTLGLGRSGRRKDGGRRTEGRRDGGTEGRRDGGRS